jgi:hypothetical protein
MSDARPDTSVGSGGDAAIDAPVEADARHGRRCPDSGIVSCDGRCCIPSTLFVSPYGNDESGDGTEKQPFRTFAEAMRRVQKGQTVAFEKGTWGPSTSGDKFDVLVPDGVKLTSAVFDQSPSFVGDGTNVLAFEGDAVLLDIYIGNFARSFDADRGIQELSYVHVDGPGAQARVRGTAHLSCTHCEFWNIATTVDSYVLVSDTASASFQQTLFYSSTASDCNDVRQAAILAAPDRAECAPEINLKGVSVIGSFVYGIDTGSNCGGSLNINLSEFKGCFTAQAVNAPFGSSMFSGPAVVIEESSFAGAVTIWFPSSARVRGSKFVAGAGFPALWLAGYGQTFDLGRPDDPGNNTIRPDTQEKALRVSGAGCTVMAVGNTWYPGRQGADAQGHYAPGTPVTPDDPDKTNIDIWVSDATPCQVEL